MGKAFAILFAAFCVTATGAVAQDAALFKQKRLSGKDVASANYSGITRLDGNRYAVVSDKEEKSGFRIFTIDIDTLTGRVLSVTADTLRGFRPAAPRDEEGICYFPESGTLFISGEEDQQILEYDTLGLPTGRKLDVPAMFGRSYIQPNRGFEALTYSQAKKLFYAMTESALIRDGGSGSLSLRLVSFDEGLRYAGQYAYRMESPTMKQGGRLHLHGVSEVTALADGRLVVLEREVRIPKGYIGAKARCRLFIVNPGPENAVDEGTDMNSLHESTYMEKTEIADFTTRLNLLRMNFANYEGMCPGPRLADGRQTLLLIDDTQAGAGNSLFRLSEHLKVIVF